MSSVVVVAVGTVHAASCTVELRRKCHFGDSHKSSSFISRDSHLPTSCWETRLKILSNFHCG